MRQRNSGRWEKGHPISQPLFVTAYHFKFLPLCASQFQWQNLWLYYVEKGVIRSTGCPLNYLNLRSYKNGYGISGQYPKSNPPNSHFHEICFPEIQFPWIPISPTAIFPNSVYLKYTSPKFQFPWWSFPRILFTRIHISTLAIIQNTQTENFFQLITNWILNTHFW